MIVLPKWLSIHTNTYVKKTPKNLQVGWQILMEKLLIENPNKLVHSNSKTNTTKHKDRDLNTKQLCHLASDDILRFDKTISGTKSKKNKAVKWAHSKVLIKSFQKN